MLLISMERYVLFALSITLMCKTDVQVDYGSLARDLYLVQLADKRGKVFQQWGKDYYCWKPVSAQKQQ